MTEWEYCILTAYETSNQTQLTVAEPTRAYTPSGTNRLQAISELGRAGWELVAIRQLNSALNEFYFKRPRR